MFRGSDNSFKDSNASKTVVASMKQQFSSGVLLSCSRNVWISLQQWKHNKNGSHLELYKKCLFVTIKRLRSLSTRIYWILSINISYRPKMWHIPIESLGSKRFDGLLQSTYSLSNFSWYFIYAFRSFHAFASRCFWSHLFCLTSCYPVLWWSMKIVIFNGHVFFCWTTLQTFPLTRCSFAHNHKNR